MNFFKDIFKKYIKRIYLKEFIKKLLFVTKRIYLKDIYLKEFIKKYIQKIILYYIFYIYSLF